MPSWFSLFLLAPALLGSPALRRDGPTILAVAPRVSFGREMVFSATVQSTDPVQSANLIVEDSDARSSVYPVDLSAQNGFALVARRDLQAEPIFPFSSVAYWWEVIFASGNKIVSEKQTLQYLDDRFSWQALTKGRATVRWVEIPNRREMPPICCCWISARSRPTWRPQSRIRPRCISIRALRISNSAWEHLPTTGRGGLRIPHPQLFSSLRRPGRKAGRLWSRCFRTRPSIFCWARSGKEITSHFRFGWWKGRRRVMRRSPGRMRIRRCSRRRRTAT